MEEQLSYEKRLVYLADDHALVAQGLVSLLLTLPEVGEVQHFKNGLLLLEACKIKEPDLVFLDLEMPILNGLDTLSQFSINRTFPVVILTMNDEKSIIEKAMKMGAKGFIHKNCEWIELQSAVRSVMKGEIYLSEIIQKSLLGLNQNFIATKPVLDEELSPREKEVLACICDGLSSKEIGEKLFISSRTVETHKSTLMKKLDVNTTGKLIALAIKNKLI